MGKQIDWSRPIRCKDGRPARVLATDLKRDHYLVVVAVLQQDGSECVVTATIDGRHFVSDPEPFFENIPERFEFTRWVNVYPDGPSDTLHGSHDLAKQCSLSFCIATVPVTISGERGV